MVLLLCLFSCFACFTNYRPGLLGAKGRGDVRRGGDPGAADLARVVHLLKDRAETLEQLADGAMLFCGRFDGPAAELTSQHLTEPARHALEAFARGAADIDWTRESISVLIKSVLAEHGLKMPQLAIPLRVAVAGTTQTPAIDAVLEILGREKVLARLTAA